MRLWISTWSCNPVIILVIINKIKVVSCYASKSIKTVIVRKLKNEKYTEAFSFKLFVIFYGNVVGL